MAPGPTLADVGEFALIALIAQLAAASPAQPGDVGIGDDAAVIGLGGDPRVVATTDLLVEGRHFRLDWSSAYDIGRRAAAQNLADLEAMGARPVSLLVGFAAPGTTAVRFAEDLVRGLVFEARSVGAFVSGGDTVRSDRMTISVTALGALDGRAPVLRSGAQAGDVVYAAGLLGWSAAGLALLSSGDADLLAAYPEVVAAHRVPQPPYGYGVRAALAGATAMIDVSDGLLADLAHVVQGSSVGAEIESASFHDPTLDEAGAALGVDVRSWCTTGGEDHALLFTLPGGVRPPAHSRLRRLGSVVASPGVRVDGVPVAAAGFDHFTSA
ncbi:MAG: thiamine-phosphate kinase [Actinomycetota bacterium]